MNVVLETMNNEAYELFLEHTIVDYAKDKVEAGTWEEEEAVDLSREQIYRLLPQGKDTKNHYLYSIVDQTSNEKAGHLWFNVNEKLCLR